MSKVLVVVVTPALYQNSACLREIHTAIQQTIEIFPILFEGPMPEKNDVWPLSAKESDVSNAEHASMVHSVWENFCCSKVQRLIHPGEGGAQRGQVVSEPEVLSTAVDEITAVLTRVVRGGPGSRSSTSNSCDSFPDDSLAAGAMSSASSSSSSSPSPKQMSVPVALSPVYGE